MRAELEALITAHQAAINRWRDMHPQAELDYEPGWTSFVLRLMEAWIADEREAAQ